MTMTMTMTESMTESLTVGELLRRARARLGGDEGRNDAEALLCAVLDQSVTTFIARPQQAINEHAVADFQSLLERRARGEPVAYLLGQKEFWSLTVNVTPDVLIPRAETELLVEEVVAHASRRRVANILELGTGSGAIALALTKELPQCAMVATDISVAALKVAKRNAQQLGLQRIEFCSGDWFGAVPMRCFDLIVANPPYVAADDPHLQRGDVRFEPDSALVSRCNGLADIERIIVGAPDHLNAGGTLLLEHGYDQSAAVRALLKQNRFTSIVTRRDLGGHERVSSGQV